VADALQEDLVAFLAGRQVAQVGAMPPDTAPRPWQRAQFWLKAESPMRIASLLPR
jgi:hypothetical protein